MRYTDFKIAEARVKEQQTPQNVADLATTHAALDGRDRNLPIPVEIADPVLRLAPSLRQFVTYNSKYGIVGIKTVNGNTIRDLQTSLNRTGNYNLSVDGNVGNNTHAAIIDIFYTIAATNGIGESSIKENQFDDIVAATGQVYVIGDSHAKAMGGTNNLASDGANLDAIAQQASRVPNGATVYMTGGHNDVAAGENPGGIAGLVKSIITRLESKGCTVNYILFPEGTDNTNQNQMGPTRQAITTAVTVGKDLDGCSMQGDGIHCSLGSYRGIVTGNAPSNAPANTPAGDKQDRDNNMFNMEGGLEAGPPYPPEQVDAVKALQTELQRLGYSVGSTGIDGKYGPRTSRAVKAYQSDFGQASPPNANFAGGAITADGITALQSASPKDDPTPTGNEGQGGGSGTYDLPPLSDRDDVQGAVKAVRDFIAQYESKGHYDIRNGESRDPAIPNMTIDEILQYQLGWRRWSKSASSAIGRYQYTRATLEWMAGVMGVNTSTQKFDPEFQDKLCVADMRQRCRLDGWLNGSVSDEAFINLISAVWAAIPNSSNRSTYQGVANNSKGLDYDETLDIISQIKTGLA